MMTHDVEGAAGRDVLRPADGPGRLVRHQVGVSARAGSDADELASSAGRRASAQRGFEVNLHDLNHDGHLFHNREQFLRARGADQPLRARVRLPRVSGPARCIASRTGSTRFEFSYDMSVPNVAHLEPQRGGCCTVMPYFVGDILELPLTTTQDYSLFHILGDYSIDAVEDADRGDPSRRTGSISFIAHPDYLVEPRARRSYVDLLAHLQALRDERNLWWRCRAKSTAGGAAGRRCELVTGGRVLAHRRPGQRSGASGLGEPRRRRPPRLQVGS